MSSGRVFEVADLQIDVVEADAFEAAVHAATPHFQAAIGCESFRLQRSIERPDHYRLVVGWTSVEAHMVDFRSSPGFQAWRELVGRFFVAPPSVEHVEDVFSGF